MLTKQTAVGGGLGHGPTKLFPGALALIDRTRVEVFRNPKATCPAMTVPVQVPCGPLRRLVADWIGSVGTKFSPPTTVPLSDATTLALVVPVSINPTTTFWPSLPWACSAETPTRSLLKE